MARRERLPEPHWHRDLLDFASCPCISQQEYDNAFQFGPVADEEITVRAPIRSGFHGFVVLRSVLLRSPTFATFFASPHYLERTRTHLWLLFTEAEVFALALDYLHLRPVQDLKARPLTAQIRLKIRLYFLAKQLQLPPLEDIAYQMLRDHDENMTTMQIVDVAKVIYHDPIFKDVRIRGFLQMMVERNLRALLNEPAWRLLIRETRPSLAADLFELTASLLLEGDVGPDYPPILPRSAMPDPPPLAPFQDLCAIAIRAHLPDRFEELLIFRGDKLTNCAVCGDVVVCTDAQGRRGSVPRDYVDLFIETRIDPAASAPDLAGPSRQTQTAPSGPAPSTGAVIRHRRASMGDVGRGGSNHQRNKASWILGMDEGTDVFVDRPAAGNGGTGGSGLSSMAPWRRAPRPLGRSGSYGRGSIMWKLEQLRDKEGKEKREREKAQVKEDKRAEKLREKQAKKEAKEREREEKEREKEEKEREKEGEASSRWGSFRLRG